MAIVRSIYGKKNLLYAKKLQRKITKILLFYAYCWCFITVILVNLEYVLNINNDHHYSYSRPVFPGAKLIVQKKLQTETIIYLISPYSPIAGLCFFMEPCFVT